MLPSPQLVCKMEDVHFECGVPKKHTVAILKWSKNLDELGGILHDLGNLKASDSWKFPNSQYSSHIYIYIFQHISYRFLMISPSSSLKKRGKNFRHRGLHHGCKSGTLDESTRGIEGSWRLQERRGGVTDNMSSIYIYNNNYYYHYYIYVYP